MKTPTDHFRKIGFVLWLGSALWSGGCGQSAQQQAYESAMKAEQQLTVENTATIITAYQRVIALQPGTVWARKARDRIGALTAKTEADELHKSVFQEHGVD